MTRVEILCPSTLTPGDVCQHLGHLVSDGVTVRVIQHPRGGWLVYVPHPLASHVGRFFVTLDLGAPLPWSP